MIYNGGYSNVRFITGTTYLVIIQGIPWIIISFLFVLIPRCYVNTCPILPGVKIYILGHGVLPSFPPRFSPSVFNAKRVQNSTRNSDAFTGNSVA